MEPQPHGHEKYPNSVLLESSAGRGWHALAAEFRRHSASSAAGVSGSHTEIALVIDGRDGVVTCKVGGKRQTVPSRTGAIWLSPTGVAADEINIAAQPKAVHLYIPSSQVKMLADQVDISAARVGMISSKFGIHDEMIRQIGLSVLSELTHETAAGRMLVETSALMLAARLVHSYSDRPLALQLNSVRLDPIRLARVLEYIAEHLENDISVDDLASVACLSKFHFTRMFTAAVGLPPHRYVSQRRLEHAMNLTAKGERPLSEIALASGFSSQASFTRAFQRVVGVSPGQYRRASR